jgi:putative YhdH/YhfP family quinone oxidoreductase
MDGRDGINDSSSRRIPIFAPFRADPFNQENQSMPATTFRAMVVEEGSDGRFTRSIRERSIDELPQGDVLIRVHWSSLNYKDALSASGVKGVTKSYPHTPGIDAAGVVEASSDAGFRAGDRVIVTGYDLGQNTWGGFGEYIRVPAEWVVPLPEGMSLRESMSYGTAGYTAALAIHRLQHEGIGPDRGELLVTGSTGGVGSLAVAMLATAGYHVVAATGKGSEHQFLRDLGAAAIVSREEILDESRRPLQKGRWAGVVDTVGGAYLESALAATQLHGAIACCGNVASHELHTTVYPFILRGVALLGIDSGNTRQPLRGTIWRRISQEWNVGDLLDLIVHERSLDELDREIERILRGGQRGRAIVKLVE